jgi:hypothetical protein
MRGWRSICCFIFVGLLLGFIGLCYCLLIGVRFSLFFIGAIDILDYYYNWYNIINIILIIF